MTKYTIAERQELKSELADVKYSSRICSFLLKCIRIM